MEIATDLEVNNICARIFNVLSLLLKALRDIPFIY